MKLHTLLRLSALGMGVVAQHLAAASPHLVVEETTAIAASPELVWQSVKNFNDMRWHPAVASTQLTAGHNNEPQAIRRLTLAGGGAIVEQLLAHDDQQKTQRYTIIESPLPVDDYQATLTVSPDGSGMSVLKWEARFRARDADGAGTESIVRSIRDILQAGLYKLKATMETTR